MATTHFDGELVGKYRLRRLLGKGGMGTVFEAEHQELGKRAAVKLLLSALADDERAVRRFMREARAAAGVGHPAIVDVYDVGMTDNGTPYLVMELLAGESLAERLKRVGRLELQTAVYVACQVLSALEATHAKGIVHRDIKPENIYLVETAQALPAVKLLDFGISKVVEPTAQDVGITLVGTAVGTPHYMAPEQAIGQQDIDGRADIFAVGVLLYACLAGKLPYTAEDTEAHAAEVLRGPQPLGEIRVDLPRGVDRVVSRAVAWDRDRRYHTATAMLAELLPFLSQRAVDLISLPAQLARQPDASADDLGATLPPSEPNTVPLRAKDAAQQQPTPAASLAPETAPETVPETVPARLAGAGAAPAVAPSDESAPAPTPPAPRPATARRRRPWALLAGLALAAAAGATLVVAFHGGPAREPAGAAGVRGGSGNAVPHRAAADAGAVDALIGRRLIVTLPSRVAPPARKQPPKKRPPEERPPDRRSPKKGAAAGVVAPSRDRGHRGRRRSAKGELRVSASAGGQPLNAKVYVDGRLRGTAPLIISLRPGRHRVTIKHAGHLNKSEHVEVKRGRQIKLRLKTRRAGRRSLRPSRFLPKRRRPGDHGDLDGLKSPFYEAK